MHTMEKSLVQNGRRRKIVMKAVLVIVLLALMGVVMVPLTASAKGRERFVLNFGDGHYRAHRGQYSTLFLKREMIRQYPRLNIVDYRLKKVVVMAKTKHGRGRVQLRVGPEITHPYRVGGHPGQFHRHHPGTFDRVRIRNPFADSWGPWQLRLQGNFKVRKVVLIMEERGRRHYGTPRNWNQHWYYGNLHRHYGKDRRHHKRDYRWQSDDGQIHIKMKW